MLPIFITQNLALADMIRLSRCKKQGLQNRPNRRFVVDGKVVGNWGSEVRLGFDFFSHPVFSSVCTSQSAIFPTLENLYKSNSPKPNLQHSTIILPSPHSLRPEVLPYFGNPQCVPPPLVSIIFPPHISRSSHPILSKLPVFPPPGLEAEANHSQRGLSYHRILRAGHAVPADQPAIAFAYVRDFVLGRRLARPGIG